MIPSRILVLVAHPDDECYCAGGSLAHYTQQGAQARVISATRGQAGEIHDASRATRQTLGQVREAELKAACAELGVTDVICWDYMDGHLSSADQQKLTARVREAITDFAPDVVITFGDDGAYGHPDHIAIGAATTNAIYQLARTDPASTPKLYYAHFPERNLLLMEEISKWLVSYRERFSGSAAFAHGLSLFARESTMLHYSKDFVDVRWYPPQFFILEQGEPSRELFVILSGSVEVRQITDDGSHRHLKTLTAGDFFGELGVTSGQPRTADIITQESTTCLVFSPGERALHTGRGSEAVELTDPTGHTPPTTINVGDATHMLDVRQFVQHKINAVAQHRTQTPIDPQMFPTEMLEHLFGLEFFIRAYPPPTLESEL